MEASEKLLQKLVHMVTGLVLDTPEAVREQYRAIQEDDRCDALQDAESELRGGECETGLPAPSSRHYESREVAARMLDGSWVGWTYWYGGGKHGEPESMPWIEEAYDVQMTEVKKVVREFTRADPNPPVKEK